MRNSIGIIALSLLAATAVAGCNADSDPSGKTATRTVTGSHNPGLTGELAKYNAAIVPLANACDVTGIASGKVVYNLASNEIIVMSLRSVDLALLANGKECLYNDAKLGMIPVTSKVLKELDVNGIATTAETLILDVRNGLFGLGNIIVDLKGQTTNAAKAGDEVAVLGTTGADKMLCSVPSAADAIDLNADKTADIKPTVPGSGAKNHFTIDLNSGDDTFDQGACTTALSIFGSAGKDAITVGSVRNTVGDVFSGGTDGTSVAESADTITFAARTTYGVTVTMDTSVAVPGVANDGDGDGKGERDNVFNDFEVLTATAGNDNLTAGALLVGASANKFGAYTLNGGAGNDVLVSKQNFGTVFNGGTGVDTVDYSARTAGVVITMDGKTADDGEKASGADVSATLDNVAADVENLIGSDYADKITGNTNNNVIKPGNGADVVVGDAGDDTMLSGYGVGTDALDGDDIFQGGTGTDTVDYSNRLANATKGVTVKLDNVFNAATVAGTRTTGSDSGTTTSGDKDSIGVDVENAVGTTDNDTITGSAVPNSLWTLGGTDVVTALGGIDQVDGNPYTAKLLTPNGYWCTSALVCFDPLTGVAAVSQANCDCKTPKGYRCSAVGDDKCLDPGTGAVFAAAELAGIASDCDCSALGVGVVALTGTCNPSSGTPVAGLVTAISTVGVTCQSGSYTAGTCNAADNKLDCGGDSLDVASCNGTSGTPFVGCWKTQ